MSVSIHVSVHFHQCTHLAGRLTTADGCRTLSPVDKVRLAWLSLVCIWQLP